jgi:hypothetical protein
MGDITIYSPYEKVYNYWSEKDIVEAPAKIRDYLLLLPTKDCPEPIITNDNPRARLVKYLYYDEPNPLNRPLPSVQERLKMIFDPFHPDKPSDPNIGYRVFCQSNTAQANIMGQTIMRIVMGQMIAQTPYIVTYSVNFQLLSNYTLEANTQSTAELRTFNMEQCIIQALHGVNMFGVGSWMLTKSQYSYGSRNTINNGGKPITDDQELVGRLLTMSFESRVMNDDNDTSTALTF